MALLEALLELVQPYKTACASAAMVVGAHYVSVWAAAPFRAVQAAQQLHTQQLRRAGRSLHLQTPVQRVRQP